MLNEQRTPHQSPLFQEKANEISAHPAWHGVLSGLEAEGLLRYQDPFTYLIRQGEKQDHFYLSYVNGQELFHLPFTIDYSSNQWFYRNSSPTFSNKLEAFIPAIMHREARECLPLAQFATQGV